MATKDQKRLVRLDPHLAIRIATFATYLDKPAYAVLEDAVREYLANHRQELDRCAALTPRAEAHPNRKRGGTREP